jgi:2-polyprenyl-3-methyl-5-hydroxy-6-metoxy-1,4-benzoquinol methylase
MGADDEWFLVVCDQWPPDPEAWGEGREGQGQGEGVREEVVEKLLVLNQDFYEGQAASFAQSRAQPQPGFARLLDYLPQPCESVLDVGCGEGRFGRFIQAYHPIRQYVGVDYSTGLLAIAQSQVRGADTTDVNFYQREMTQPGFLAGLGEFEAIACLAVLHHIPGRDNRARLMEELAAHLSGNGRLFLSTWQFLDSQRQRRKVHEWTEIGLSAADVEPDDYLLSWQRGGFSYRYACMIDAAETAALARATDLHIVHQFRSDGKEGDLSLYTVFGKR